jgi:hypothetical protein
MSKLLYSIHDRDAHPSVPAGGWVVESIALSENPQPQDWSQVRGDINWILRLNWAHNGKDGTIPLRGQYDEFAKRCTDYLMTTRGAYVVVIANEPNHAQEYPNGTPITPEEYADCFNRCYASITNERPDIEVLCAAVAPWDVTSGIDWLAYYKRMLTAVTDCDGLAVHGYTHGADPNLIWSTEKQHGWYWHFPVIYQTIQAIPARFASRPVHVTETDQSDGAWADTNSGWVQNAYQSVDEHNRSPGTQKIVSLALYRWRGDKYEIYNKGGLMDDFNRAVSHGYLSPGAQPDPTPPRPTPEPGPGGSPPTPTPEPDAVWDQRLTARGCTMTPASAAPSGGAEHGAGEKVYRLTVGKWFDEEQAGGRVNIFMRVLDEAGNLAVGVPLTQFWSSGEDTKPSEVKSDPFLEAAGLGAQYSGDFGMTNLAPSYGVVIDGANPSDKINGCGLGSIEQPNYKIHTAYFFEWQLSSAPSGLPITPPLPIPPLPPTSRLVWPVAGPITQPFGAGGPSFGQPGHGGIDIAVPEGTPVVAIADGEVMYTGWDENYGHYVRVYHDSIHSHSFCAHNSVIYGVPGELVFQGEVLAASGNTGNSTGPHCHFELRSGTRDAYYEGVTYGYSNGRYNPVDAYVVTGSALAPGVGL